jgi:hypothetical protein
MQFYKVTFGLAGASKQAEIIQLIKSNGGDAIQTSDGLCIKASDSMDKIKDDLDSKNLLAGINIQNISASDEGLSTDVQRFLST